MKFIHTADIHWGMVPDSDRPWGKKREQAIRLTFQAIIEDARDSHAHAGFCVYRRNPGVGISQRELHREDAA